MNFFPEVDIVKTKKNAIRKLKEYIRWCLVDGDMEQKVTQTYSLMPRQTGGIPTKTVEKLVVNKVSAEQEINNIREAINRLPNNAHRRILIEKYIQDYSDTEIHLGLGYEKTQYYQMKQDALLAFAHSYRQGILVVLKSEN